MIELEFPSLYEGFVYGLDEVEYRRAEGISQSNIKTLLTEPYKYFNQIQTKTTDAMIEGTLLHLLLSEPHRVGEQFLITNVARVTKEIKEEAGERYIFKEDKFLILKECVDSLKFWLNKELGINLDDYDSEVSYFGEYEGIKAKGRADKLSKDKKTIFDFKKTKCASQREFTLTACRLHYGIQEVFYRELMGAENFGWIAIETEPMVDIFGKHHFMFGLFESDDNLRERSKKLIGEALKVLENKELYSKPFYPSEFLSEDINSPSLAKKITTPVWYLYER